MKYLYTVHVENQCFNIAYHKAISKNLKVRNLKQTPKALHIFREFPINLPSIDQVFVLSTDKNDSSNIIGVKNG